jgi:hypothetical protein
MLFTVRLPVTFKLTLLAPIGIIELPFDEYKMPSVRFNANSPAAIYELLATLVVLGRRPDTDVLLT